MNYLRSIMKSFTIAICCMFDDEESFSKAGEKLDLSSVLEYSLVSKTNPLV